MALNLGTILYSLGVNVSGMQAGAAAVRNFAGANNQAGRASKAFSDQLRALESASVLAVGPLSGLGARIRSLSALTMFGSLQFAAITASIVGTGFALTRLAQGALHANQTLTATRQRLLLLTGSTTVAAGEMRFLTEVADRSGSEFKTVADSYSRFIASVQGTALEGQAARDVFEKITMAGANLVLSNEEMEGTFRALTQMMSKGTVQAEELRGQLGDRLVGAFRIAAQAVGATTSELGIMLKKGQVIAADFLPKFADAFVKAMGVDTTKRVDNLLASQNRLNNAYLTFSDTLDRTLGISQAWRALLDSITGALISVAANLNTIIPIFGAISGAIIGLALPRLITALGTIIILVRDLTVAMLGLNLAMAANPGLALLRVLVALGAAAAGAYFGFNLLSDALSGVNFGDVSKEVQAYLDDENNLRKSLRATTDTYIREVARQIQANELRMQALKAQLADLTSFQDQQIQKFPKLTTFIRNLFGLDPGDTASTIKQIKDLEGATDELKKSLAALIALGAQQDALPDDFAGGAGSAAQTDAQLRRIEKTTAALTKLREEVAALQSGPSALEAFKTKFEVEDAVLSYKQSLEQTGLAQEQVNAQVEEFRRLMQQKIDIQPAADAAKELQDIFISASKSIADALGEAFVEGQLVMEDFVNIGKKLLAQLISKLIEVLIFNQLLNAAFGTALPTSFGGGLGGIFNFNAKGGVLTGPAVLGFNNGKFDIGGEAGKEAVMPLVRTSGGDLGVQAVGGGSAPAFVDLSINVFEGQGTKTQVQRREDGGIDIRTMIDDAASTLMMEPGTKMSRSLRSMGNNIPLKRF